MIDILFGKHLDTGAPRLLSLGTDRMLVSGNCDTEIATTPLDNKCCIYFKQVEYDLANSSVDDLKLSASDRIEQSAIPTAMIWYPPITKESFLLITNSQVCVHMCILL